MARSKNFQVRVSSDTSQFDAGMRKAQQSLRSFQQIANTAFGLGGLATFTAAIGGAVRNIMDFEKANSELAAVLGTNIKGVEDLSKAAKELGRQSKYTASEVTGLQVALARLGFDNDQIQAMEGSILKFATAMGTDLSAAADFTGSALRAFNLQAKDTKRLLDVMSAATTKSALDFSKLQASISIVAPIANAFGLSVEETAAFLGVLANNGFDASSAATALRNILLNLADENGKLAKGIGHSAKTFDEIIAAFKELSEQGVDVAQVLDMTDTRSAAAAVTIIKQADATNQLKRSLDGADGSLDQMADTMKDNLAGSVDNLKSAWEGFTLALSESAGMLKIVVDAVTKAVNILTDHLESGISLVEALMGPLAGGAAAKAWMNNEEAFKALIGPGGVALMDLIGPKQQPAPQPAPEPRPANSVVALLRDRNKQPETTTTTETTGPTAAELKKAADARAAALRELQTRAREAAAEAAEVAAADAEIDAQWESIYERWRATADLPPVQPFDNETLLQCARILHDINEEMEFQDYLDNQLQESIEKLTNTTVDFSRELENLAVSGLNAAGEALGGLLGDLATGGDAWSNFSNAAISAFGDMAIAVGRIAVAAGAATLGIKAALESMNGYAAIAAGVALIALGAAVKTGLSNVASGNYSATGSVASGSYSAGGNDYETRDIQVNVTGTLQADGDKLVAVLNNTNNRNGYTT